LGLFADTFFSVLVRALRVSGNADDEADYDSCKSGSTRYIYARVGTDRSSPHLDCASIGVSPIVNIARPAQA
jgi:hypothetical protein